MIGTIGLAVVAFVSNLWYSDDGFSDTNVSTCVEPSVVAESTDELKEEYCCTIVTGLQTPLCTKTKMAMTR